MNLRQPRGGGTCVLTLHRVVEDVTRDHDISTRSFVALLNRLRDQGRDVERDLRKDPAVHASVVLTFDDGTVDHARAAELMAEQGIRGVFFVSTERLDTPGYLSRSEVVALHEAGHVIGAHAHRHRPLATLADTEVDEEVQRSTELLADIVGAPVDVFAPPGGWNTLAWRTPTQHPASRRVDRCDGASTKTRLNGGASPACR